jgi:RNA polymerase sigma-70 factor (ECF subfamily)
MILAVSMNADKFSTPDDAVARLRNGDTEALGQVMTQYHHRLYRFLLRLAQDSFAADDLFQQTWIRVMDRIRHYDSRHRFEPWLFTVARNLAIDYLRQRRPDSLDAPDAAGVSRTEQIASHRPDPLEQMLDFERGAILAAAISHLPLIHREVLTLRFEEDMKLEDIAQVAGVPLSTVKSRLGRALESLRDRLEYS